MADRNKQLTIIGNGNIVGDHSRANVGGGKGQSPPLDLDGAEAKAARQRYREALRQRYNVIETHAFSALANDAGVGSPRRLPLLGEEGVYVPLTFDLGSAPRDYSEARRKIARDTELAQLLEKNPDQLSAAELRALPQTGPALLVEVLGCPGQLAIIGDAGSGKTTILQVILSVLAAENPAELAPELYSIFARQPLPLPVFLPLRLFEQACCDVKNGCYHHCAADLLRFIDDWFRQWCPQVELPVHFLEAHIRHGRAWLLLDALDEVADADHRETVRNIIQELTGQLPAATRVIVTARVAAYRNTRLDDRFTVVTVRDLDGEQRTQLVQAIYRGLALPDHQRRASELAASFHRSEALQALGRTPVMIWTAAVIHALRGELPESRAALYAAYVEILLKQSFKRTRGAVAALAPLTDSADWPLADRRHYLTYAAFKVHALLESQPERQTERQVVVGEDELLNAVLGPYFQANLGDTPRQARDRAREFVTLMVERSGLLYENEQGYSFGDHLTMQEFLATYYLVENYPLEDPLGYATFLQEQAKRSWWREIILLSAGYLGQKSGFQGRKFLQQLTRNRDDPEAALASLALAGRGLLQLRAGRKRPTWYRGLAQDFANRLYSLLYAKPAPVPVATRHAAGLVLGRLCGLPGDETGVGDPRFTGPQGLPAFVAVPGGAFWMGDDNSAENDERPRHKVVLDAYEVARYPTTNAMYAHFIAAGGYADEQWWTEAIVAGDWKEGKVNTYVEGWQNIPRYWDDTRWNNPSQPVVGVNWYAALAYCRWLTAKLDDGYIYRLPTEAEWERAARGSEGWMYPWGNDWREGVCNSKEARLEQTSPVGLFPGGATEAGLHDMEGNVWEWCRDWYTEDAYADSALRNPAGPASGEFRVLRGGSWYNDGPSIGRCGWRVWDNPGCRYYDWGFRCVRIFSSVP